MEKIEKKDKKVIISFVIALCFLIISFMTLNYYFESLNYELQFREYNKDINESEVIEIINNGSVNKTVNSNCSPSQNIEKEFIYYISIPLVIALFGILNALYWIFEKYKTY